ncbi:MAG: hypothetical protein IPL79_11390 [Myxococcales bacterium]|nr:hypothetical protein [Myxococcales bacterium]
MLSSITSLALAVGAIVARVPATVAAPAPAAKAPPSRAINEAILDAIAEEMNRAIERLQIPGAPKPYHISYKITEVEVINVSSTMGSTLLSRDRHFVSIEARVRVGSFAFDNGNFIVPRAEHIDGVASTSLPLEATPRMARRAAWLVTDAAYKEALIQLRAKTEARDSGALKRDIPSWEAAKAFVSEEQVLPPAMESLASLTTRANALSKLFAGHTGIRDSRVAFTTYIERRWYLNSEGTSATDARRATGVSIVANGQASDGQDIAQYYIRYGTTEQQLPTDAQLASAIDGLIRQLQAQSEAPSIDRYTGPILFEGEAATAIARHTLTPHLGGTPLAEGLSPQQAKRFGGALSDKVGLRVFPAGMSVSDDPSVHAINGVAVIGGYKFDDEGIVAQRVEVAKNGVLTALLKSRTPAAKGDTSNGHARRVAPGGMFFGTATNTVIAFRGGLARAALRAKLLAIVKEEGLPFGLIIRQLDDAAITGAPEFTRREILAVLQNADLDLPPPATLAYRLYPNGREELLRGVQLAAVPIRAWKDIVAGGNTSTVSNFLASPDPYLEHKLGGGAESGFVPTNGIESSVSSPDLLFRELDVLRVTGGQRPRPIVAPPAP